MASGSSDFNITHSLQMFQASSQLPTIPTLSQKLDKVIAFDGVELGTTTEILGLPGSGKSQLCMQLCASTRIPKHLNGLEGEAIYVDTTSDFDCLRYCEIVQATVARCSKIMGGTQPYDIQHHLTNLRYIRILGFEEFCAFMNSLNRYTDDLKELRLFVIDSICFPMKDNVNRNDKIAVLFRQMALLERLAKQRHFAVVVTNEMSMKRIPSENARTSALGDGWSQRCSKRILLSAPDTEPGVRYAVQLKNNEAQEGAARFKITNTGIVDLTE